MYHLGLLQGTAVEKLGEDAEGVDHPILEPLRKLLPGAHGIVLVAQDAAAPRVAPRSRPSRILVEETQMPQRPANVVPRRRRRSPSTTDAEVDEGRSLHANLPVSQQPLPKSFIESLPRDLRQDSMSPPHHPQPGASLRWPPRAPTRAPRTPPPRTTTSASPLEPGPPAQSEDESEEDEEMLR